MVKDFIEALMEVALCSEIDELKDHLILNCVWRELETKLDIGVDLLKSFWYRRLHMQLFCPEPIYLNDVKIKLIE